MLVDVERLVGAYYDEHPDHSDPAQAVSFGTSGHRGSSLVTTSGIVGPRGMSGCRQ